MSHGGDNSERYEIKLASYTVDGWLGVVFSTVCCAGAFLARQYGPIPVFGLFGALGVYTILGAGKIVFYQDGVIHQTAFRMYGIYWKEVTRVEIGVPDGTVVLHGDNKRFVVAPPSAWSGPQKSGAYSFFAKQIEDSGMGPFTSTVAAYKIHKNVSVYANSRSRGELA
jgi:hypothetical protein